MKDYVYLSYYQVMSIMYLLREIQEENPEFNNDAIESFTQYVIERTSEIESIYPTILRKIVSKADKYKIEKDLYYYLSAVTGIDVQDRKTLKEYTKLVKEFEENLIQENVEQAKFLQKKSSN